MRRNLKRMLCVLIASVLFLVYLPIVYADVTLPAIDADIGEILYFDDMEVDIADFGSMDGTYTYEVVDEEHGRSLKLDSTSGSKTINFIFSKAGSGAVMDLISFEMMTNNTTVRTSVDQYLGDSRASTWRFRVDGQTRYTWDYGGNDGSVKKMTPINEWARYDVAFDYKNRMTYGRINLLKVQMVPLWALSQKNKL